jgi:hypothetical protein
MQLTGPLRPYDATEGLRRNEMTKITNSTQSHKSYRKMGVHGPPNISEVGSVAMEE